MKKLITLILFLSLGLATGLKAQYNPYLNKKKKNKPSAVMAKQNRKDLKRQKKMAKRQMRHSKRNISKRK